MTSIRSGLYTFSLICCNCLPIDRLDDSQHTQPHRTIARAVAAPGAERRSEFLGVGDELVVNPLPLPLRLYGPRVVPGGVLRECRELAGVPVPHPHSLGRIALIHDV